MNRFVGGAPIHLASDAPPPPVAREDDLDMTAIFRLIRRRIWLIGTVTTLITVAAIPVLLAMDPLYHARTRFLVQAVEAADPALAPPPVAIDDEVERLRSRRLADQVIARFNMAELPEFNSTLAPAGPLAVAASILTGADTAAEADPIDTEIRVANAFTGRLSVWRELDSRLVQIGFTSTDPALAAAVPNAMVEIYRDGRDADHRRIIDGQLEMLDRRIERRSEDVARASEEIEAFRAREDVVPTGGGALQSNRMVMINEQLLDLRSRRADISARIAAAEASLEGSVSTAIEGETDNLFEMRRLLQTRQRELDRMRASYGSAYGGVRVEEARIEELENSIWAELSNWVETMRLQLVQMEVEEAALLADRAEGERLMAQASASDIALADLLRRADDRRAALEALEDRRRDLEARRAQPAMDLEILAPAAMPINPEGRSRKTSLLMVAFAALVASITLAAIREAMDDTVRSLGQLADLPDLEPLGILPRPSFLSRIGWRRRAEPGVSNSLRSLVAALRASEDGNVPGSLAVTEASPEDGAAAVARQLAAELCDEGLGVLLIDARPGAVRRQPGLADYLRAAPVTESYSRALLDRIIVPPRGDGPHMMFRGTGTLPSLHSQRPIMPLLDYAAGRRLTTIFICPPVLGNASAMQVVAASKRTLMVIGWGKTPRTLARYAVERLRMAVDSPVLAVLRDVQPARARLYPHPDVATFARTVSPNSW